jgi:energy-coupling factor transport system ATP-binding protein
MIRFEDVSFSYDGSTRIISGLNYVIEKGSRTSIYGKNGAGKTTLVNLIGAMKMPDSGKVSVDGRDTGESRSKQEIRKKIFYVFNNPDTQIIAATVEEDIAFNLENRNLPAGDIKGRVEFASRLLEIEDILKLPVYFLSPVDKLKVVIAGMAAGEPQYIILDCQELFYELWGVVRIEEIFSKMAAAEPLTVVWVTSNRKQLPAGYKLTEMSGGKLKDL